MENRNKKKIDSGRPSTDSIYCLFLFDLDFRVDLEYRYGQHEHVSYLVTKLVRRRQMKKNRNFGFLIFY
jgi:hypothetical protein